LFEVTEQLLSENSTDRLVDLIYNSLINLFQSKQVGIFRLSQTAGIFKINRIKLSSVLHPHIPDGEDLYHLYRKILPSDDPIVCSAKDINKPGDLPEILRNLGMETVMIAPMLHESTNIVLAVAREAGSACFTAADMETFVIFARQAAVALENARLYSELKENVRRVEETHLALVQAEKMAAVGRLVASMAHEINNPLQAVRNCLHLASHHAQLNPQCQHYLDLAEGEMDRLSGTVRRMLDFYRPSGMEAETILIQQILEKVLALIGPQLREQGTQVHLTVTGEKIPIHAVSNQIQQVIFNLLMNSMDALDEIPLEVNSEKAKEIWVDLERDERNVFLRIEDSGYGLAEEVYGHLFEPFVSTKRHGTGLGLAVSYEIIERHQGRLSVIPSRHGEGACFEISLPAKVEVENVQNIARG
jgi:signal transduction histidine kinase